MKETTESETATTGSGHAANTTRELELNFQTYLHCAWVGAEYRNFRAIDGWQAKQSKGQNYRFGGAVYEGEIAIMEPISFGSIAKSWQQKENEYFMLDKWLPPTFASEAVHPRQAEDSESPIFTGRRCQCQNPLAVIEWTICK